MSGSADDEHGLFSLLSKTYSLPLATVVKPANVVCIERNIASILHTFSFRCFHGRFNRCIGKVRLPARCLQSVSKQVLDHVVRSLFRYEAHAVQQTANAPLVLQNTHARSPVQSNPLKNIKLLVLTRLPYGSGLIVQKPWQAGCEQCSLYTHPSPQHSLLFESTVDIRGL